MLILDPECFANGARAPRPNLTSRSPRIARTSIALLGALLHVCGCDGMDGVTDLCPDDAHKTQAGVCGCGVSDDDENRNGVPDCFDTGIDLCPDDAHKTQSGTCGCGASDDDGNQNGVPDCLDGRIDLCPSDDGKTVPGTCGCDIGDADASGNGIPDCLDAQIDFCPDDADKTLPGVCGCGTADVDADEDSIPDCLGPVCVPLPPPMAGEVCNGMDDNCDGTIDEEAGGDRCSTPFLGVCAAGVTHCVGDSLECTPYAAPGELPERCDGLDNDCDGDVDNGPLSSLCPSTPEPGVTWICEGQLGCRKLLTGG